MIDFKGALRTTVLLVDDDFQQLNLRTCTIEAYGFSVVAAVSPVAAIAIMNEGAPRKIDIAVIDYHMPVMNGCVLAEYLKTRYPSLKVVVYSGALDISKHELGSVDVFVPKADGIRTLLAKITEFGRVDSTNFVSFAAENNSSMDAVN